GHIKTAGGRGGQAPTADPQRVAGAGFVQRQLREHHHAVVGRRGGGAAQGGAAGVARRRHGRRAAEVRDNEAGGVHGGDRQAEAGAGDDGGGRLRSNDQVRRDREGRAIELTDPVDGRLGEPDVLIGPDRDPDGPAAEGRDAVPV